MTGSTEEEGGTLEGFDSASLQQSVRYRNTECFIEKSVQKVGVNNSILAEESNYGRQCRSGQGFNSGCSQLFLLFLNPWQGSDSVCFPAGAKHAQIPTFIKKMGQTK